MNSKKINILVIGAGIAGLGTAYELQKNGKQVTLLENNAYPGGRMSTLTIDGMPIDLGAKFLVPSVYKNISKFSSEFNLSFRPITARKVAVIRNGELEVFDGRSFLNVLRYKGLSTKSKFMLGKVMLTQLVKYRNFDMYRLDDSLPLDDISVYDYFKPMLNQECFDYFLNPMFSALFGYDTKQFSRALFLSLLPKIMKMNYFSFEGGINKLCVTLAGKVSVQYNMIVTSLKRTKNEVVISGVDKKKKPFKILARIVIVAVPGHKVLSLLGSPTTSEKTFFSQVKYSETTIINFKDMYSLFTNFKTIWFPEKESKYFVNISKSFYLNRNNGIFSLSLRESFVKDLKAKKQFTKEYIAKLISKELKIQDIDIFNITEWDGMCPKFYPGYLRKRHEFLEKTKEEKQIFYCGDYMENPSTEGALTSGLRTADMVLDEI